MRNLIKFSKINYTQVRRQANHLQYKIKYGLNTEAEIEERDGLIAWLEAYWRLHAYKV